MNARAKYVLASLLVLALSAPVALAQQTVPNAGAPGFAQQELDQMLAPIALYPDSLLSQILMASTYPLEVVEAARWVKANPGISGDQAVRAVEQFNWDPSVKSLVAFPQVLAMMDDRLNWTERLGDAFLGQQAQVMDTVQSLRQRAYAAGNLRSTDQLRVEPQGQIIAVEPADPQLIYVPYYDPNMVYGPWAWPAYPPVYWAPWPGYYVHPGFIGGFAWGPVITVSTGFFFGRCDWHNRHVAVVHNRYYNTVFINQQANIAPNAAIRNNTAPNTAIVRSAAPNAVTANNTAVTWQHDPVHRRAVPYPNVALRQQFGRAIPPAEPRREFRGHESLPDNRGVPGNRPDARSAPANRSEEPSRMQNRLGNSGGQRPNPTIAAGNVDPRLALRQLAVPIHPNVAVTPAASRGNFDRPPQVFGGTGEGRDVRGFNEPRRASLERPAPTNNGSAPRLAAVVSTPMTPRSVAAPPPGGSSRSGERRAAADGHPPTAHPGNLRR